MREAKMRRSSPVNGLLLLVGVILIAALLHCSGRDAWFDDGCSYLCLDCRDLLTLPCCGECTVCGAEVGTICYKYCYDCAKALDRCQICCIHR